MLLCIMASSATHICIWKYSMKQFQHDPNKICFSILHNCSGSNNSFLISLYRRKERNKINPPFWKAWNFDSLKLHTLQYPQCKYHRIWLQFYISTLQHSNFSTYSVKLFSSFRCDCWMPTLSKTWMEEDMAGKDGSEGLKRKKRVPIHLQRRMSLYIRLQQYKSSVLSMFLKQSCFLQILISNAIRYSKIIRKLLQASQTVWYVGLHVNTKKQKAIIFKLQSNIALLLFTLE